MLIPMLFGKVIEMYKRILVESTNRLSESIIDDFILIIYLDILGGVLYYAKSNIRNNRYS